MYKCGIDPNYFLDEMTPDEVNYLSDAFFNDYKEKWEMHRTLVYSILAPNSKKIKSPTDVMKFDWDGENENSPMMSKEEILETKERIKKKFNIKN